MSHIRVLFIAVIVSAAALYAQKNSDAAKVDSTVKSGVSLLQQKILLNDEESEQITKAVITWLNDKNDLETSSILTKIESYLDKRQKSKFQIVKDEWWEGLVKEINSDEKKKN